MTVSKTYLVDRLETEHDLVKASHLLRRSVTKYVAYRPISVLSNRYSVTMTAPLLLLS